MHASGVHATVAGVLLGLAVPVRNPEPPGDRRRARPLDDPGLAAELEHLWRPISAGVAVPMFALFAAGVLIGGWSGLQSALADPSPSGSSSGSSSASRSASSGPRCWRHGSPESRCSRGLTWPDGTGIAVLGGIGFTVSLLMGELAFGGGSAADDHVKVAVLAGSVAAAVLAAILLRARNRRYRALYDEENRDDDHDGIPDIYEQH